LIAGGLYTWWRIATTLSQVDQTPDTSTATAGLSKKQQYVAQIVTDATKAVANGDTAAATAVYDKAIEENSNASVKSDLYAQKASTLLSAGDKAGALEAAQQAVAQSPDSFEALFMLANAYEATGDKANAALTYRKIAAIVPDIDEDSDENPSSYGKQYYIDLATELEK
jgi:tetratricopeptide (TPR) repeat protein